MYDVTNPQSAHNRIIWYGLIDTNQVEWLVNVIPRNASTSHVITTGIQWNSPHADLAISAELQIPTGMILWNDIKSSKT